jgi:hypothetical protein
VLQQIQQQQLIMLSLALQIRNKGWLLEAAVAMALQGRRAAWK